MKIGRRFSVISTGKDTHNQMQKAYLKGKRNPLPVEENGVDFKDIHVVFMMNPVEEFRNQYTQSFVNGLTIPSAAESAAINAADGLKLATD